MRLQSMSVNGMMLQRPGKSTDCVVLETCQSRLIPLAPGSTYGFNASVILVPQFSIELNAIFGGIFVAFLKHFLSDSSCCMSDICRDTSRCNNNSSHSVRARRQWN